MSIVATEDMNYLAQQQSGKINMILAGMTALMNDIEGKASAMESQNWFQRMAKTIAGKNKLTLAEIRQNHEKMNVYLSEAIAELYNRNCIDHNVMMSLGVQINELYADHTQLKQMLGAFVGKLNEKIDSVDNFHMLVTEIDHGVYSQVPPIVAVCQVMSQFDNRILEDNRKLDIISRSLYAQNILNGNQIKLTEYLASILVLPMEDVGQIHLELGTIRDNFMASVILGVMESYYFLPDLARKMKDKRVLIEEIIQAGRLDASVSLSMDEIYDAFLDSKINVKNGLVSVRRESPINEDVTTSDIRDYAEITELGCASYFNEEDYSQAVKYFSIAAEGGYAEAQYWLGHCYYYGDGVAENETEGFKWFMKAAQQDYPDAQLCVGHCYYRGDGVAENKTEGFKWYMKAAQQDYPVAQYFVGNCYYYGDGVAENKTEGFKWYMKAAQQDYPNAQYFVGNCYYFGDGVAENKTEGFKWFMKAAQQDFALAQCSVGCSYMNGEGIAPNTQEAFKWFMKAAEQGGPEAQYFVGDCYYYGDGVAENKKEAFKWFMKAAEQGDPDAQYMVGLLYSKGGAVMLDRTEAFKWFMKAAEQGNANAQLEVGKCYHGGSGTSQNYQKAEEWLRRSASQGNEEARQKMGQWYHQYVF